MDDLRVDPAWVDGDVVEWGTGKMEGTIQRIWHNSDLVYEVPSDDELLRARVRELRENAQINQT